LAAIDSVSPTAKDIKVLFPEHAQNLWKLIELGNAKLKRQLERAAAEDLKPAQDYVKTIREYRAIDVRKDDPSGRHKEVLTMISANIPVYRIVEIAQKGGGGMSSFLFVNDRWIHIKGFSEIPKILPMLDELLKRAEAEGNAETEN
jgi:hypothetical protein